MRGVIVLKKFYDKVYILVLIVLIFSIVYQGTFFIIQASETYNESSNYNEEKTPSIVNDLYKMILRNTLTPLDGKESETFVGLSKIVKQITKLDLSDPKTFLSFQMPLLEEYEYDDVKISTTEEQEIYNLREDRKPMNDNSVQVSGFISKDPLVLLYHTHTTESYTSSSQTKIDYSSPYRSLNENQNVVAVGEVVTQILENQYGIKVIHDTTINDYPDFNKSYSNSLKNIKSNLEKHPTIEYVFDIHRDGLANTENNIKKYHAVFNGVDTSKIMIVLGLNHSNSDKNQAFANKIYFKLDEMYQGITVPIIARQNSKYNQFVSDNAVLFEIGSNLSTLEEAKASAECLGHVLGKMIIEEQRQN